MKNEHRTTDTPSARGFKSCGLDYNVGSSAQCDADDEIVHCLALIVCTSFMIWIPNSKLCNSQNRHTMINKHFIPFVPIGAQCRRG